MIMSENKVIDYRRNSRSLFNIKAGLRLCRLVGSTFIYSYVGLLVFLWRRLRKAEQIDRVRKIVILGFGGIGNHLMCTPAIEKLKHARPDFNIHFVASAAASAEIIRCHPAVDTVTVINVSKIKGFKNLMYAGRQIRQLEPDVVMSASGLNPVTGSLLSQLSCAKIKIGENWRGRGILYTHWIKANTDIYEARQNNRLARNLLPEMDVDNIDLKLFLPIDEKEEARKWLKGLRLPGTAKPIGIHPGSGLEQQWKRWPLEKYVRLSQKLYKQRNLTSIFFLGPDEKDLRASLIKHNISPQYIYFGSDSILKTAARIGCCQMFVSNDSGLRQIAVALGVKTTGVFGPTGLNKNFFKGHSNKAVYRENVLCRPCHYTKWRLACGAKPPCLALLPTAKVVKEIFSNLA